MAYRSMAVTEAEVQEAVNRHEARNAELLRLIESKGANASDRYQTEHHFWAYTQKDADGLAAELSKRGYLLLALAPGQDKDGTKYWNIEASFDRTLAEAASREVTEELVRLAGNFGADYDGWGVSI